MKACHPAGPSVGTNVLKVSTQRKAAVKCMFSPSYHLLLGPMSQDGPLFQPLAQLERFHSEREVVERLLWPLVQADSLAPPATKWMLCFKFHPLLPNWFRIER